MEELKQIREQYFDILKMFSIQRKNLNRLWNISQETGELLFKLILQRAPGRILEIGTSNGFSTFWLSRAADQLGVVVDTIDIDQERQFLAKDNLKDFSNINFYFGLASEIIPALEYQYEFIFLDANKSLYYETLLLLIPKLKNNCWIIADNTISHKDTVNEYLDYVRNSLKFETETLDIGTGLELSKYIKGE